MLHESYVTPKGNIGASFSSQEADNQAQKWMSLAISIVMIARTSYISWKLIPIHSRRHHDKQESTVQESPSRILRGTSHYD